MLFSSIAQIWTANVSCNTILFPFISSLQSVAAGESLGTATRHTHTPPARRPAHSHHLPRHLQDCHFTASLYSHP